MNQLDLFALAPDFPFKGAGHRRTHMGAIMEQVVCAVMGFTRNAPGGSSRYQPDAYSPGDLPVEIKSVCINSKLKGKSVLYDYRLNKDAEHAPRLAYAFACHQSVGKGKARTAAQFIDRLTDSLVIAMVPAWVVRMDAEGCALQSIRTRTHRGKRCGYQREGYCNGYRNVEVHRYLRDADRVEERAAALWGREFRAAVLWTGDPWRIAPPSCRIFPRESPRNP